MADVSNSSVGSPKHPKLHPLSSLISPQGGVSVVRSRVLLHSFKCPLPDNLPAISIAPFEEAYQMLEPCCMGGSFTLHHLQWVRSDCVGIHWVGETFGGFHYINRRTFPGAVMKPVKPVWGARACFGHITRRFNQKGACGPNTNSQSEEITQLNYGS